jgi:tetratricopeptide (TPR) repeat protein
MRAMPIRSLRKPSNRRAAPTGLSLLLVGALACTGQQEAATAPPPPGVTAPAPVAPGPPEPGQPSDMNPGPPPDWHQREQAALMDALDASWQPGLRRSWGTVQGVLEDHLDQHPEDVQARVMVARALLTNLREGSPEEERRWIEQRLEPLLDAALALEPGHREARMVQVEYLVAQGRGEEALAVLGGLDSVEAEPRFQLWHLTLEGRALQTLGRHSEASERLREAARSAREQQDTHAWVSAMEQLARSSVALGSEREQRALATDLEAAREAGEVVWPSPSSSCVFSALGELYASLGEVERSAVRWVQAADGNPLRADLAQEAAVQLLAADRPRRALSFIASAEGAPTPAEIGPLREAAFAAVSERDRAIAQAPPEAPAAELALALEAFDAADMDLARLHLARGGRRLARGEVLLGFVLLLEQDYDLARTLFDKGLEDPGARPGAEVGLAHLSIIEHDFDGARSRLAAFARGPASRPEAGTASPEPGFGWLTHRMALLGLGWAASNQARHAEASAHHQRVLDVHPDDPLALLGVANAATAQGEHERAAALLEHLLSVDPGNRYALAELGLVRMNLGQLEQAEALLEQARTQEPERYTCPHEGLGLVYLRQGRTDEAEQAFRKAIDINPDIEYLKYNGLARLYLAQGRTEEAIELLEISVRNYPHDPEARELLEQLRGR